MTLMFKIPIFDDVVQDSNKIRNIFIHALLVPNRNI